MIRRAAALATIFLFASFASAAELSDAVKSAKVSLESALPASESKGKPISAKYELEDGKLQLSVYTAKAGKFYEVVVDHATGKITKTEEITSGDDLAAAKEQSAAMAQAKRSLRAAVMSARKAHGNSRAISVTPEMKNAHPVGVVTLSKGNETVTATEKLD